MAGHWAIRLTLRGVVALVALAIVLTGCAMRQYDASDAEANYAAGQQQMEGWMARNCPEGTVVSMENAVRKLPGGPERLLPCVKGEMSDGSEVRDFLFNTEKNEAYLDPGNTGYRAFQNECLLYALECLGLEGLPLDGDDEAFFYLAMVTEKVDSGQDYLENRNIDDYGAYDYVKVPGELVLSGGDLRDFVRSPDNRDVICVELNAHTPGDGTLPALTMEQIESIERARGLYFAQLDVKTDADELCILWDNDERFVDHRALEAPAS